MHPESCEGRICATFMDNDKIGAVATLQHDCWNGDPLQAVYYVDARGNGFPSIDAFYLHLRLHFASEGSTHRGLLSEKDGIRMTGRGSGCQMDQGFIAERTDEEEKK